MIEVYLYHRGVCHVNYCNTLFRTPTPAILLADTPRIFKHICNDWMPLALAAMLRVCQTSIGLIVSSSAPSMGTSVTSGSLGMVLGTVTISTPLSNLAVMPVSSAFSGSCGRAQQLLVHKHHNDGISHQRSRHAMRLKMPERGRVEFILIVALL